MRGGVPLTCRVSPRESGLCALGRAVPAQQQQLLRVREQQFQRIQLGQQRLGMSSALGAEQNQRRRTRRNSAVFPSLVNILLSFHGVQVFFLTQCYGIFQFLL